MLADYYMKPLQGQMFNRFRAVIMGWAHFDTLQEYTPPSKECVGDSVGEVDGSENIARSATKPSYADVVKWRQKDSTTTLNNNDE